MRIPFLSGADSSFGHPPQPGTLDVPGIKAEKSLMVATSLSLAAGYGVTITNKFKEKAINVGLEMSGGVGSSRNAFKEMFPYEAAYAKKEGQPSEHVGGEAGVWDLDVPVAGEVDPEELVKNLSIAIEKYKAENEQGLRRIHQQNKMEGSFEERNSDKYRDKWLKILGQHKDDETKKQFVELGVKFTDGKHQKRADEEMQGIRTDLTKSENKAFEVMVVGNLDLNKARNYKEIAEKQPAVRIVILKNAKGKVDRIIFMHPHFNINGRPGVDFAEKMFEECNIESEDRPIRPPEIIRETEITYKKSIKVPILDIRVPYKIPPLEERFRNDLRKSVKPKLYASAASNLGWQVVNNERSGYVCVDPDDSTISNLERKEGDPEKAPPAELQTAWVVAPAKLHQLKRVIDEKISNLPSKKISSIKEFQEVLLTSLSIPVDQALAETANTLKLEFEQSKKGISTGCFMFAYTDPIPRKVLETTYEEDANLVSKGPDQTSFVSTKLKGAVFTSALTLRVNTADAKIETPSGAIRTARFRTKPVDYLNAVNYADSMYAQSNLADGRKEDPRKTVRVSLVREKLLRDAKEKVISHRKFMLLMGVNAAIRSALINNKSVSEIIEEGYKAYLEIEKEA
ncbi:MAG TPA: hypothetical protein PLV59_01815 [Candidatus Dojkabacteria bacterium]|nr:hypothetical protein [Candidatus Dojkabacteria bacterium]